MTRYLVISPTYLNISMSINWGTISSLNWRLHLCRCMGSLVCGATTRLEPWWPSGHLPFFQDFFKKASDSLLKTGDTFLASELAFLCPTAG